MPIDLGATAISNVYLGATAAQSVYLGGTKLWPSQVQYLSKGAGKGAHNPGTSPGMSWTHTVESDANCLVVLANAGVDGTLTTNTCSIGSTPMTQADTPVTYSTTSGNYYVFIWVQLAPPTGALTMNYALNSSSTNKYLWANSYSFKGVSSYSAVTRNKSTSNGTALSLAIASTVAGELALAAFSGSTGTTTAWTSTTAGGTTLDSGPFVSGTSYGKLHISAPGNGGTVNFTGTAPSTAWGGAGFRLIP